MVSPPPWTHSILRPSRLAAGKNPRVSPTCVKVRADEKAAVGMLDLRRQEEFSVMRPSQLKQEGSILHNIKMREKKSGKVRFMKISIK